MKQPREKRKGQVPSQPTRADLEAAANVGIEERLPTAKPTFINKLRQLSAERDSVQNWLPMVTVFATDLFVSAVESCRGAGLFSGRSPQFVARFLKQWLLPLVIEDYILPERSRKRVLGKRPKGNRVSKQYGAKCDSPYGLLELCLCEAGVDLRPKLMPDELDDVSEALTAHLKRLAYSYAGLPAPLPRRQSGARSQDEATTIPKPATPKAAPKKAAGWQEREERKERGRRQYGGMTPLARGICASRMNIYRWVNDPKSIGKDAADTISKGLPEIVDRKPK